MRPFFHLTACKIRIKNENERKIKMNCENCKKARATVFYADESGRQHSLCASCAKILGKLSQYDPSDGEVKPNPRFLPNHNILLLKKSAQIGNIYFTKKDDGNNSVCPYCSTSLSKTIETGRVGCPECYTVFSDLILPSSCTAETAHGAKMPSARRESFERLKSIAELKAQIKIAVESENYELAATLRDKIRKLENMHTA